ncbi:CLN3 protein-domain-containing protein [Boletus edulis]|nr:CLN3 protein-domain-containing protein [Boletus edulis]
MSLVLIRSREDSLEEISSDKPQGEVPLTPVSWGVDPIQAIPSLITTNLPPSTPKGIIAFCNIFPALLAKLGWPYFLKGKIRYSRRIVGCALLSFIGMLIVALYDSLPARLLGISIASFSSGLGELTFLQLSITYNLSLGGQSVGYFASGTGAAGLVGAFMWWEVRGLGVRLGVGVSAVGRPFCTLYRHNLTSTFSSSDTALCIALTYFLLLPRPAAFMDSPSPGSYTPLPEEDPDIHAVEVAEGDTLLGQPPKVPVFLTAGDKWRLVKPMVLKYMLPLFLVYTFEYTINQVSHPELHFSPAQLFHCRV